MKNIKKLISFILVLSMIFSFVPAAYADVAFADVKSEFINLNESGKTGIETKQLEYERGVNKQKTFDFDKYGLVKKNLKDAMSDRLNTKSNLSKDNKKYVEDVAAALSNPIGAIDMDEFSPNEKVDIIVWLQQLPTALKEAYGEDSAMGLTDSYEALGVQARETIKLQYGGKSNYQSKNVLSAAIKYEYSVVFSGFAMTVTAKEAKEIAAMPGVYAVNPDTLMYANEDTSYDPNYDYTGMLESREAFQIGEIHKEGITGKGVVVGVLDTGIDYNHPDLNGVYKNGWNYILPAADFGRPETLKNSPMETTYEQWEASGKPELNDKESEFYTSHGTHVSGTIASKPMNDASNTYKALGMAPDVDLYVARVLGPYGSGATTGIIAAVEDFAAGNSERGIPKADVINLSLGSDSNTAYGDNVFALNNAVLAGVNVSVSAGNNASKANTMNGREIKTLGTPGTAYLPITVAASQYGGQSQKTYDNVIAHNSTSTSGAAINALDINLTQASVTTGAAFGLLIEGQSPDNAFSDDTISGNPAPNFVEGKGYEAYLAFGPTDTNPSIEQLAAIPNDSLKGKILVVKRGLDFTYFRDQAIRTGAGALIIVNNAANGEKYITNMAIGGITTDSLPIFSAYHSTSAKLTALAEGSNTAYLQLGELTKTPQSKYPAYFSSIGPVNPVIGLKPDIIAPGWQIISTAPAYMTTSDHNNTDYSAAYQNMSGTSMSAPHVAGILALMKQQYPDATPAEIKARLMNTAKYDNFIKTSDDSKEYNASVLEIGAGFIDPYRALIEEKDVDIYITVADDIPGIDAGKVIENMTLSSLSFGRVSNGDTEPKKLPVKVHGTTTSAISVEVVYNNNTRYSENAQNNVQLKFSNPVDGAFDAWIEVSQDAAEGYYEGWLKITSGSKVYVLPWLAQVGEDKVTPFDNLFFTSERPIISTSEDENIRSAGLDSPLNSNNTTLWFAWEGAWPTDTLGNSDLDLYLVKPENISADSITPDYYYDYVRMDGLENDGTGLYRVEGFIADKAFKVTDDGPWNEETIANGTYYIAVLAGDGFYVFDGVGVVFTDGTGDYEVQLTIDENIEVDPNPEVTTVEVKGRVYSPALKAAADAGFFWTDVNDFWMSNKKYQIDQSFNILGYKTIDPIAVEGTSAYNTVLYDGKFWICDADGYFSITMPVTSDQKDGGYPFDLNGNHSIVGVEGFYYNNNGPSSPPMIGANKSASAEPRYMLSKTKYEVTFKLNGGNIGGSIEDIVEIIEENSTVQKPAQNPVKPNYTFAGWFEDGKTAEFDFTTPIASNLTLTAMWYSVIDDGDDSGGSTGGTTPTVPTAPKDPTEPVTVTVTESMIDINVDNGNAEVSISKDAAKIIKDGKSDVLSVSVDEISGADSINITIPTEVTDLLSQNNMSITCNYGDIITFVIVVDKGGELAINYKSAESVNDGTYESTNLNFDIKISNDGKDIDNTKNTVKIRLNAKGLENLSKAGVYTVDENGNVEYIMTYLDGNILTFYPPHFSPYSVMTLDKTFNDIKGHWAQSFIEDMASKQIVKGKTEEVFAPEDVVTRAEFVTMVVRALDLKGEGKSKIANIDSSKWYANYISLAKDAGLIEGTTYDAEGIISRLEMAKIIAKAHAILNGTALKFEGEIRFTDISADSADAEYIGYANEHGLIDGFPGDLFMPLENTTRAQAIKVIHKLVNK